MDDVACIGFSPFEMLNVTVVVAQPATGEQGFDSNSALS